MDAQIIEDIERWLDEVVIGLNLCPFAARPRREGRVRIAISQATNEEQLLDDLQHELEHLADTPVSELETTLLAIPHMLADFADYNDFLDAVDLWLEGFGWEGELQVASFHPGYQFVDTDADVLTGDAIVTSGLTPTYPEGLYIGEVVSFETAEHDRMKHIMVETGVDFTKLYRVMVLQHGEAQ